MGIVYFIVLFFTLVFAGLIITQVIINRDVFLKTKGQFADKLRSTDKTMVKLYEISGVFIGYGLGILIFIILTKFVKSISETLGFYTTLFASIIIIGGYGFYNYKESTSTNELDKETQIFISLAAIGIPIGIIVIILDTLFDYIPIIGAVFNIFFSSVISQIILIISSSFGLYMFTKFGKKDKTREYTATIVFLVFGIVSLLISIGLMVLFFMQPELIGFVKDRKERKKRRNDKSTPATTTITSTADTDKSTLATTTTPTTADTDKSTPATTTTPTTADTDKSTPATTTTTTTDTDKSKQTDVKNASEYLKNNVDS